uniref:Uncharacterized protein n=1 Tax=Magnetococcus massalia (strain MO-1) TaxID=451514 RepID=A0A1S7LHX3_MAGMO|nr:protein of unknown function [Candidatus Magnetococcus massalia]
MLRSLTVDGVLLNAHATLKEEAEKKVVAH